MSRRAWAWAEHYRLHRLWLDHYWRVDVDRRGSLHNTRERVGCAKKALEYLVSVESVCVVATQESWQVEGS